MDSNTIRQLWQYTPSDKNAVIELWDSMARDFGGRTLLTPDDSAALTLAQREGMIHPDSAVLDVGCGAGRYSLAMARYCRHVVGTDISPKMIGLAQDMASRFDISNADFYQGDWDEIDIEKQGWTHQFDLVFAHMTPAVDSPDTLDKLSAASRKWCLMCKPTRRTDSVTDRLREELGLKSVRKFFDDTIMYCFGLLWSQGYLPRIEYDEQVWDGDRPLDQAKLHYARFINARHALNDAQKKQIGVYLESIAEDGRVKEKIHTTVAMMYWAIV